MPPKCANASNIRIVLTPTCFLHVYNHNFEQPIKFSQGYPNPYGGGGGGGGAQG